MPSPRHLAIIAAAGSHKTEFIVNEALARTDRRVLLTTYTLHNLACIEQRIYSKVGHLPAHITIMSWYSFLSQHWCRPYQRAVLGAPGLLHGIDFDPTHLPRYIPESRPRQYFCNRAGDLYMDRVANFAIKANAATSGAAVRRLEEIYDEVYVDEIQDLAGYDLAVLDGLLHSSMHMVVVGDPRQATYSTNKSSRLKQYRGSRIVMWLAEQSDVCVIDYRTTSYRCNQVICDFADALYPDLPPTTSENHAIVEPMGILMLSPADVYGHVEAYAATILRHDVRTNTLGLPAINFGAAKGSTHGHVVIFPTEPIRKFLATKDISTLTGGARSKLYVAVTRAEHSVAFVMP